MTLRAGSLFTGYGGLDMAINQVFGSTTAWVVDNAPGPTKVLAHRYPEVPNLLDITAVDWDAVEPVGILGGGFPCQDVSLGGKQAGMKPGTRSGLWSYFAYGISRLRPQYVVIENVRGLLSANTASDVEPCPWCVDHIEPGVRVRALGAVLADLADLGYDACWYGVRASDVGAPHSRFRVFILARNTEVRGRDGAQSATRGGESTWPAGGPDFPAADASGNGRQWRPECDEWSDVAERGSETLTDSHGRSGDRGQPEPLGEPQRRASSPGGGAGDRRIEWGPYAEAVARWEGVLGRLAPSPTELAPRGGQRLSPAFVEWMQGLPAGHVSEVPGLSRNEMLKLLGNGVVPQQAVAALNVLIPAMAVAA